MNKGTAILGIWGSIVALVLVIMLRGGIEFFGILILIGIACAMTIVIMNQSEAVQEGPSEDVIELRETVKALDEKIDELKKLLEE